MGLSYLSKKSWHPGTFQNIEKVWTQEQKKINDEKKAIEHIKKLKEEKQIEDMKRLQVEAGIIPASSLQKIEWMYQDRSATNNANTAEEYLLGKAVKEIPEAAPKDDRRKPIVPVIRDTYTTPENEAFIKMMEDPLLYIKQKELEARSQVFDNPLKMKQIRAEIEALKEGKKKKKHKKDKKKKSKKDKKDKSDRSSRHSESSRHTSKSKNSKHSSKRTRSDSRSSSGSDSSSEKRSRKQSKDKIKSRRDRSRSRSDSRENRRKQSQKEGYGLQLKGEQLNVNRKGDLGPDMGVYGEKKRQQEEVDKLRKRQEPAKDVKKMTPEEREAMVKSMTSYAQELDEQKNLRVFRTKHVPDKESLVTHDKDEEKKKDAKFLRDMGKDVYLESDMKLEDRLNRNKHYRARDATRD